MDKNLYEKEATGGAQPGPGPTRPWIPGQNKFPNPHEVLVAFKDGNEISVDMEYLPTLADGVFVDKNGDVFVVNTNEVVFIRARPVKPAEAPK